MSRATRRNLAHPVVEGRAYHGSLEENAAGLSFGFVDRQDGIPAFLQAFRVSENPKFGGWQRESRIIASHRYGEHGLDRAPNLAKPREVAQAVLMAMAALEDRPDAVKVRRLAAADLRRRAKQSGVSTEHRQAMIEAARLVRDGEVANPLDAGHLFTVRLDSFRPRFLHWTLALEFQPQVRHALRDLGYRFDPAISGAEAFDFLTEFKSLPDEAVRRRSMPNANAAAEVLLDAGLAGIRYLDADSHLVAVAPEPGDKEWRIHAGHHPSGREVFRATGTLSRHTVQEMMERRQSFHLVCLNPDVVSVVARDGQEIKPVKLANSILAPTEGEDRGLDRYKVAGDASSLPPAPSF